LRREHRREEKGEEREEARAAQENGLKEEA
jgi:hypothetical protein